MPISRSTLARGSALLLLMIAPWLQGCSLWPRPAQADTPAPEAAEAPAFQVQIEAPADVRALLQKHLDLLRFRTQPDLLADELQRLADAVPDDARQLLATQGYFSPTVQVQWEPAALAPPRPDTVIVQVTPGPITRIETVTLTWTPAVGAEEPGLARQQRRIERNWELPVGEPFTQAGWDQAKTQGLRTLQTLRYPTAQIAQSQARIDASAQQAHLSVQYAPGPLYRFGPLQLQGGQRYDTTRTQRLARLPTGSDYDEADMLDAQQRLASSGYYDTVYLQLDTNGPDPQNAPVIAQVREAPLQKLVLGVGASTDSGPRLSMEHIHNQMPGLRWRAVSKLALDRDNQEATTNWTDLPDAQGWRSTAGSQLQRQKTGELTVNTFSASMGRTRASTSIDRSYGLQYDASQTQSIQGVSTPDTATAISLNLGWTGRYFNSLNAPTRGWGLAAEWALGTTLRPYRDPFTRLHLRWQAFVPAGSVRADNGAQRSARLALRAEAGAVLARTRTDIPLNLLFITGGDTTVRGYGYRSIGARTEAGQLYGGRYLGVASVEWQRPIVYHGALTDWETTTFVDAGAVTDHVNAWSPRVGVGAGVRWRSPVGPLQADLAYGIQARQLRLHLRMGFTF